MIPPYGGNPNVWAQQVRAAFDRYREKLTWKSEGSNPSQNGTILWDEVNGYPVVSRGSEFLPILRWVDAPSTASDTGTEGDAAYDGSYLYVCTATDTWLRVAIATW